jgi:hypothetical protein
MEDNILQTLKETTDDVGVLKEIDILIKESKSKSKDIAGSSKNEINGLKYIMNKHKDILCSFVPKNVHTEFMFTWTCALKKTSKHSKTSFKKRELQIHSNIIEYLVNCLKNKEIKFAAVMLSIQYHNCKEKEIKAHANLLIYNKQTNTIERFDPIGGSRIVYDNKRLDEQLSSFFQKYNINYSPPQDFCPKISFQKIQGREKQFKFGLCAAWTIWYLDFKLTNSHINDSKQLIDMALVKLKTTNSLTQFILNYIRHVLYS